MIIPDGVWTPIMSQPMRFHGNVEGTGDAYGPDLGMESLSRSPSSSMIWKRSLCGRLVGRAGDEGGCPPFRFPLGGDVGGAAALSLARISACAEKLRLMGVERDEVLTGVGRAEGDKSSSQGNSREPVDLPLWSGCGEVLGGTARIAQCSSWRAVDV